MAASNDGQEIEKRGVLAACNIKMRFEVTPPKRLVSDVISVPKDQSQVVELPGPSAIENATKNDR